MIFLKSLYRKVLKLDVLLQKIPKTNQEAFDNIDKWAKEQGASGLAYFTLEKTNKISGKGPVGKFFGEDFSKELMNSYKMEIGDSLFMACGNESEIEKILSISRDKIAKDLGLIDEDQYAFCWIIDYPMFEIDNQTKKINFSHNPFSMPQGDLDKLDFSKP